MYDRKLNFIWTLVAGIIIAGCGSSSDSENTNPTNFGQTTGSDLVIILRDHGAMGDGRTDDSTVIQKILDEAPANATIYFEDLSYLIKRPLKLRTRGIKLQGPGRILMKGGAQYAAFEIEANDVLVDSLRVINSENAEAEFVAGGCGSSGDLAQKHIVGVKVMANGARVMRSTFEGMTYGVRLESGSDNHVLDNSFLSLKGTNAECEGGAAVLVQSSFSSVQGNAISQVADKASEGGIIVMGTQAVRNDVARNEISGNFMNAILVNNEIPVDGEAVVNPTNLVYLNQIESNGILIANTRHTDVFDNQIIFEQGAVQTSAAIKVWYSRDSKVLRNDIFFRNEEALMAGIWAFQVPGLEMDSNKLMRHELNLSEYMTESGILIQSSNDTRVANNYIAEKLAQKGFKIDASPRLLINETNKVRDTSEVGLELNNTDDSEVRGLDIYMTDQALMLVDSDDVMLKDLVVDETMKGLKVMNSMSVSLQDSEIRHYEEEMHLMVDDNSEPTFSESNNMFEMIPMP